jgi:hypothetical protein
MTDWTVILTSLAAASVAGLAGYAGARMQAQVAMRGIEAENARLRDRIDADSERLREQHREEHFRHRQGVYHDLLDADRLMIRLAPRAPQLPMREIDAVFSNLDHTANAVRLFGAPRVWDEAEKLLVLYAEIAEDADRIGMMTALEKSDAALSSARAVLLEAMRDDVGFTALP